MDGPIANPLEPDHRQGITGRFLSLGSGQIIARLVAFVATAYLTRRLGPYGFGVVGFAVALCSYMSIGVSAGFDAVGAREVARKSQRAASIAAGVVAIRLILAFAAMVVTALVASVLDKPETVQLVVILTSLSFLTLALDTGWVYKGLARGGRLGVGVVLAQVGYVLAVLALVREPGDVLWVPIAQFFGELVAAVFLGYPLFRGRDWSVDLRSGLRLLISSRALTLSRLLRTLIFSFDIVLLSFLIGEVEVGLYTAAYRICLLVVAVGVALHATYLPAFSTAVLARAVGLDSLTSRALSFAWSLATPMLVGGVLLAQPMLEHLFGEPFGVAYQAFRLLLLSAAFVFLNGAFRNVYLTTDRLHVETWIVAIAASINVGLNLLLIPRYGMVGAAAATATAEALIFLTGWVVVRRWSIQPRITAFWRVIAASLGMGLLLQIVGPSTHWLLQFVLGILVYFLLLALFKGLPQDLQIPWKRH